MTSCFAIYSCWTTGDDESWRIFDHPLPLTQHGTIGRTLQNFVERGIGQPVVLYPAPTHPDIENHVKKLAAPYDLNLHVFTGEDLNGIVKALKDNGFPDEFDDVWDIANYGRFRNWMLLYAAMKGYDNVIQVDDDELLEDPNYVQNCEKDIGTTVEGCELLGKTGCYLDEEGNKFYDGQIAEYKNWPKDRMFNEGVKHALEATTRLTRCHVAFGGNTIINRKLFLNVPYDINITRGEDDDYVMNARHRGFEFFFDLELLVRHLPPGRSGLYWTRMRQDIKRFKYLREKVRLFGLDVDDLGVFYGYFLRDDLEYNAVSGSLDAAMRYMDTERDEAVEFLKNAEIAIQITREEMAAKVERQLRFMDAWAEVVPKIEGMWR